METLAGQEGHGLPLRVGEAGEQRALSIPAEQRRGLRMDRGHRVAEAQDDTLVSDVNTRQVAPELLDNLPGLHGGVGDADGLTVEQQRGQEAGGKHEAGLSPPDLQRSGGCLVRRDRGQCSHL